MAPTAKQPPRGIRNNNPGNIRRTHVLWQGEVDSLPGVPADTAFEQFRSPIYGIGTIAKILLHYQAAGYRTIQQMISRWAPNSENDTKAYITAVALQAGIPSTTPVDLREATSMAAILGAIIQHENGEQPYSASVIQQGMLLAGIHL